MCIKIVYSNKPFLCLVQIFTNSWTQAEGNDTHDDYSFTSFSNLFNARYLRILPQTSSNDTNYPVMRFEVYGCKFDFESHDLASESEVYSSLEWSLNYSVVRLEFDGCNLSSHGLISRLKSLRLHFQLMTVYPGKRFEVYMKARLMLSHMT